MENEFLTVEELSKMLKISRSTIDRWRKEGLPHIKIGNSIRFDKAEVLQWLNSNKHN